MTDYTTIILLTLFGFLALAAILLVPVYRFLRREEEASRKWTRDEIARHSHSERENGDGRSGLHDKPQGAQDKGSPRD